ncbi:MAG: sulfite exporter TauE/SafE family protein [Nitrospirota bacterium]
MEAEYTLAFTTGILGGFGHCIGMCGPLIAAYTVSGSSSAVNHFSVTNRFLPHLFYNAGRITTYMFIGAMMGLAGSFINVAGRISGFQNTIMIIAGLIMIFMGLNISGITGGMGWLEKNNNLILKAGKNFLQGESLSRYYPLGALFGFLPCGLSYTVFMAASGTGNFLSGMFTMFFFGIGTLPSLLLFGFAASSISSRLRGMLYKATGVIVIVMGCLFILKGIRLYAQV